MNCKEFDLLSAEYVEGLLDARIQDEMDTHRAGCASCAKLTRMHGSLLAALNETAPVKAPAELSGRILAAVAQEEARLADERRAYRRVLSLLWSAAAVVSAALVAAYYYLVGPAAVLPLEKAAATAQNAFFARWYEFVLATGRLLNHPVTFPGYSSPVPLLYLGSGLIFAATLAWLIYYERRPAVLMV